MVIRGAARDDGARALLRRRRHPPPLTASGDDPERHFATVFYAQEYRLNTFIFRYPKPYVALIDGVVMGGGVGMSIHGSHR